MATLSAVTPAQAIDSPALKRKLSKEMRFAGGLSGAYVRDVSSGRTLFSWRADAPRVPASVEKLYTTASALLRDGPAFTVPTLAVSDIAPDEEGAIAGDLYIVGEGDPTLTTKGIELLAAGVAAKGVTRIEAVYGDDDAWDRRVGGPDSAFGYDRYLGGQLGALAPNRGWDGRNLQKSPADYAARKLTAALRADGVKVGRMGGRGSAPETATEIARVASPPLRELARATNVPSDNYLAEMLLKGLGDRYGVLGTTGAGAAVARDTLDDFGIRPRIVDGSGLSRGNRTTPRQVVRLLERMAGQESGTAFRESLALAGSTGTIQRRMRGTAAGGNCRAKTGTLNGVSALAGYCKARDGGDVAFSILMSRVGIFTAHGAQDRMAAAIARWDGA
ncbi:MAG: D-alanyl-D-alanine carboxypeptidase/D-alanyl-D-alanine-endopeptidase [Solirubrobacteraceae bacterium]|nr:D-alanyl-D-alanine carboxypeptidase/D-alanyl-D-alanine-endopeptidase [Solirubrobacteraceae bacterium]